MTPTETIQAPTQTEGSYNDFKTSRLEPPASPAESVEPQTTEITPDIAATTGDAEIPSQEKAPRRDKTLDGRIADLLASGKHGEAAKILREAAEKTSSERIAKLERELQESRTRKPEAEPVAAAPKQVEAPAEDKEPTFKDFLAKADPNEEFADVIDRFNKATREFERKQAEKTTKAAEQQRTQTERLSKAREKYPDLDEKVSSAIAELGGPNAYPNEGISAALENAEDFGDALMALSSNTAEYKRIAMLPPNQAYFQAVALIVKHSLPTPEPPKPPVRSNNPAPTPKIGGGGASAGTVEQELEGAASYRQFKAAAARRTH